jgi:phosphatidylserine/phosphatidylglycerophosphate/cardiolipin synthase-like enzyme
MHNKFLVLCNVLEDRSEDDYHLQIDPYAVWTGSFNLTKSAALSLENALYVTDRGIAKAYFGEWEQILALSERLDWESDWCEPEWRVGS